MNTTPQRENAAPGILDSFNAKLALHGMRLERASTVTLQINVGLLCNQACRHCHLEAGPSRMEAMDDRTLSAVLEYARRGGFETIDITGGAPELHPRIESLVEEAAELAPRLMFRSNLSALGEAPRERLLDHLKAHRAVIVASFPSLNEAQTNRQRGDGAFSRAVAALRKLNLAGYGRPGSGLELDLVSNPSGAFLPPSQRESEKRFRQVLERKWGICFDRLFTFANVPLGRFRRWLIASGNLDEYLHRLAEAFNPCAVEGVMCRSLVSVDWEGILYDCDFNLAGRLPLGGRKIHISGMEGPPAAGSPIAVGDHCYTCTAGAGFT